MKREEIIQKWNELEPDERDAWIAQAVMGWDIRSWTGERGWASEGGTVCTRRVVGSGPYEDQSYPPFRDDIKAAFVVVEKLKELKLNFELEWNQYDEWCCCFVRLRHVPSVGYLTYYVGGMPTPMEAICLAALIAVLTDGGT